MPQIKEESSQSIVQSNFAQIFPFFVAMHLFTFDCGAFNNESCNNSTTETWRKEGWKAQTSIRIDRANLPFPHFGKLSTVYALWQIVRRRLWYFFFQKNLRDEAERKNCRQCRNLPHILVHRQSSVKMAISNFTIYFICSKDFFWGLFRTS